MEEDEQEKKQSFLRQEILEKNYDPQSFIDFLVSKKGETAADINNWTLEELNSIVIEYKKSQGNNISPKKDPSQKAKEIKENEQKEEKSNLKKKYTSYYNEDTNNEWLFMNPESESDSGSANSLQNSEHNIIEIDCLEPDHSPLSNYEKINIKISSPKKEFESTGLKGFFMKVIYYTFLVENTELKINRRRRYTDFEWLRKTLCRLFPGYYIPPLPLKTMNVNKPEKVGKYQRYLQRFMNGIMEDQLLKNSSLVYLFLLTEKENDLISLMGKYDNVQRPNDLKYFYSRSGKIVLDESILNNNKKKKLMKIKDNISKHNNLFTNLDQAFKNLCLEMKQVSNRMTEISNLFKEIYAVSLNNSEKKSFCKCYSELQMLFKELGNNELKNMKNIAVELKEYMKFANLQYISSFKELYDDFEYEHDLYYKVSKNLSKKKEMLYTNGPIEKWELSDKDKNIDIKNKEEVLKKILPKDTAIVNEIKKYLIYYATQLDSEYHRLKDTIEKQNNDAYQIFKEKSLEVLEDENKYWKSLESKNN